VGGDVRERALATAREVFGHAELRPGQLEAVEALLSGHDVLLVLPTGAGKSLAYQLPGVLLDGPTLVVSPLLALQQDQIDGIHDGTGLRAARISSAESEGRQVEVLEEAADGRLDFLFLAPEQLARDEVRARLADIGLGLVAIDEAHCVSTWGHDFRPDYLRLGELLDDLAAHRGHRPPVVALTATAAPPVREDVVARLGLRDAVTVVKGLARANIHLGVHRCQAPEDQRREVLEAVTASTGQGIVYVRTRRAAEDYAADLAEAGLRAAAYHAGLRKRDRADAHEWFSAGELDVIVATSAFGMGVDKPDIRYVVHAHVPDSLDSYYQEVGRAGRDGDPAAAVLFYRPEDLSLSKFFTAGIPDEADVRRVVDALGEHAPADADRKALAEATGLSSRRVGRLLNLVGEVAVGTPVADLPAAAVERAEAHRQLAESRIEMMRGYAEAQACRRGVLLGYFGEQLAEPCGACDTCASGTAQEREEADTGPWGLHATVEHDEFGSGTVMDVSDEVVTVLFDDVGYRTLHLPTVLEKELLDPAQ
jgi:ATP-dependent DNA helicase RecQ